MKLQYFVTILYLVSVHTLVELDRLVLKHTVRDS